MPLTTPAKRTSTIIVKTLNVNSTNYEAGQEIRNERISGTTKGAIKVGEIAKKVHDRANQRRIFPTLVGIL